MYTRPLKGFPYRSFGVWRATWSLRGLRNGTSGT